MEQGILGVTVHLPRMTVMGVGEQGRGPSPPLDYFNTRFIRVAPRADFVASCSGQAPRAATGPLTKYPTGVLFLRYTYRGYVVEA